MTKKEILVALNITIRHATAEDRKNARTDYARSAEYVIQLPNGNEYFSRAGSLDDVMHAVRHDLEKGAKQ